MNVECRLRELRGRVSLKEMERLTGINRGALSRYERGREFPPERDVPTLERYYGAPRADWYPEHAAPHRERKPRAACRHHGRRDVIGGIEGWSLVRVITPDGEAWLCRRCLLAFEPRFPLVDREAA